MKHGMRRGLGLGLGWGVLAFVAGCGDDGTSATSFTMPEPMSTSTAASGSTETSFTPSALSPTARLRGGILAPALTNAIAATIEFSPISAWSITTAFIPTMTLRPIRQPCRITEWPTVT